MKTPHLLLSLASLCLGGCSDGATSTIDTSSTDYWCEDISDAQTYEIVDGGGSSVSGLLIGRLITDYGDDIHDPNIVGSMDYTLTSISSGGSASLGTTDQYGDFQHTLGAGTWELDASATKSSTTCTSSYQFEIVADKTTSACIQLSCS